MAEEEIRAAAAKQGERITELSIRSSGRGRCVLPFSIDRLVVYLDDLSGAGLGIPCQMPGVRPVRTGALATTPPRLAPAHTPEVLPQPVARAAERSPSARHIPELDGVRAIAIWLVLASHLFETPPSDVRGIAMLPGFVRFTVHHGFLGVDLFFVLSGYLITGILLRSKHLRPRDYFAKFYRRRALRIFPLYFLMFALIMLAYGSRYLSFLPLGLFFAANMGSVFGINAPPSATPYWSLAVEEQFYLIWPWLVLWLPRRILAGVIAAILVIEPLVRLTVPGELALTWYHCDGLAVGALLAVLLSTWKGDRRFIWLIVGSLVAAFVVVTLAAVPYGVLHGGRTAAALRISQASLLFGALVVASAGFSGAPALAFLRSNAAAVTGRLSYCIYLVHRPLIDFYETFAPKLVPAVARFSYTEADVARALFVVAGSYAIAALSWRYFESPILQRGR